MPWQVTRAAEDEELVTPAGTSGGAASVGPCSQESMGLLSTAIWYLIAGGKQCCSMRARAAPIEAEPSAEVWKRAQDAPSAPEPVTTQPQFPEPGFLDPPTSGFRKREPALSIPSSESTVATLGPRPPGSWEWPGWCLQQKSACIEVLAVDDDTGESRWVEGVPQHRVTDRKGRDAFLSVEYLWDGDLYIQDFGPHQVRRRGRSATVLQMIEEIGLQ